MSRVLFGERRSTASDNEGISPMAVRATIELYRELDRRLGLPVAPPIVNALPPERFGRGDQATLA